MTAIVQEIPAKFRITETQRNVRELYRAFRAAGYVIDPTAKIALTGEPIENVLRDQAGKRHSIFSEMRTGQLVEEVCANARKHNGTQQYDVFHAMLKNFVVLTH